MSSTLPVEQRYEDLNIYFKIRGRLYSLTLPGKKVRFDEEPCHQSFSIDFDIEAQPTCKFDLFEYIHSKPHDREVAMVQVTRLTHTSSRPEILGKMAEEMEKDFDDWREPRTPQEILDRERDKEMIEELWTCTGRPPFVEFKKAERL